MKKNFYTKYHNWHNPLENKNDISAIMNYYIGEIRQLNISKSDQCLEIGFGTGVFLEYLSSLSNTTGIEINDVFYENALQKGHNAIHGDFLEIEFDKTFDYIFLFDVLEHISKDDLYKYFIKFNQLIKSGGKIIAKFPNGSSPFARYYQHGDLTHLTNLNKNSIKQLCNETDLKLISCKNSFRTSRSGILSKIKSFIAFKFRDLIETLIGYIYYGEKIPLDPNITVIINKD